MAPPKWAPIGVTGNTHRDILTHGFTCSVHTWRWGPSVRCLEHEEARFRPLIQLAQAPCKATQSPSTNPSIGRNVALYAIFRLSAIQYPR
jgi:hypothetical protein